MRGRAHCPSSSPSKPLHNRPAAVTICSPRTGVLGVVAINRIRSLRYIGCEGRLVLTNATKIRSRCTSTTSRTWHEYSNGDHSPGDLRRRSCSAGARSWG